MLCLSRTIGQRVRIDGDIWVEVVEIRGDKVRLAFEAPKHKEILREELIEPKDTEVAP